MFSPARSRDDRFVYFYVRTREPTTSYKGSHWMELFLSTQPDTGTGWQGYDLVTNAKVLSSAKTTMMRISGHELSSSVEISMRVQTNELMLAIPRTLPQQSPGRISLDFQWVDNAAGLTAAEDFLHGDRAPDRRACYHYEAVDTTSAP